MQIFIQLLFSTLGALTLMATTLFGLFTVLACFVTYGYITDSELEIKERICVTFFMAMLIAWGAWLTHFTYQIGISCLTY